MMRAMPVDRVARDRFASTLAAYMRGVVDNFALDEAGFEADTDDSTVRRLGLAVWYCYDDGKSHPMSVSSEEWESLRRVIAFLRSDLEVHEPTGPRRWLHSKQLVGIATLSSLMLAGRQWWVTSSAAWLMLPGLLVGVPLTLWAYIAPQEPAPPFYPFANEEQWRSYEHLIEGERLPDYTRETHARPIRDPFVSWVMFIPGTMVWAFVVAPLMALVFLMPRNTGPPDDR